MELIPSTFPQRQRRIDKRGCRPVRQLAPHCFTDKSDSPKARSPYVTDYGNHIIDGEIKPKDDAARREQEILAIPGFEAAALFLGHGERRAD